MGVLVSQVWSRDASDIAQRIRDFQDQAAAAQAEFAAQQVAHPPEAQAQAGLKAVHEIENTVIRTKELLFVTQQQAWELENAAAEQERETAAIQLRHKELLRVFGPKPTESRKDPLQQLVTTCMPAAHTHTRMCIYM